jgi:hypothetical protein
MPTLIALFVGLSVIGVFVYALQRRRNPIRKVPHEYFSRLWLCPPGSHTRWEAELDEPGSGADGKVGFHAETTHEEVEIDGPTDAEVDFCKKWMLNLDELFRLTKPAIEEAWKDWGQGEMPSDWRTFLTLDGFSVPENGDPENQWGVTYFCKPAGHYFSIELREGKAILETVDG